MSRGPVSIIVPTFNEAPNIAALVDEVTAVAERFAITAEVIFVDDSDDETPVVVREVSRSARIPVRLLHREVATGGLGGAVVEGIVAASNDVCIVMDGDLQHPPATIVDLLDRYARGDVDVVVASRYAGKGTAHGLSNAVRRSVSSLSTAITRSMFPIRLRNVTDPMTGFFLIDRSRAALQDLRPSGFKILLEILARCQLRVAEVDFDFAKRLAGQSKASLVQGLRFLVQLAALRFGKMSLFAVVGGIGAVANVLIVWALARAGVAPILAAVIAAETTIVANFLLIDRFVFPDLRDNASGFLTRFAKSAVFNNAETLVRLPIVALMITSGHVSVAIATAITLVVAFFARFVFHALVVYSPRRLRKSAAVPIKDTTTARV